MEPRLITPVENLDSDEILNLLDVDKPKGVIIFNTTDNKFQGWNGTTWVDLNG